MLNESIHDKGKLKFIFLAGAPGSGKTHLAKQLYGIKGNSSFGATGLKLVSFDHIFEYLLKKKGLTTDLNKVSPVERERIRADARYLMKRQMALYAKNNVGMIFDGTGSDAPTYANRKKDLEDLGYDTSMVYVDTNLLAALNRNKKRDRKLPQKLLHDIWQKVKGNKKAFERIFGDDMVTINNSYNKPIPDELEAAVHKILERPLKNKIGLWRLANGGKLPNPKPYRPYGYDEKKHGPYDPSKDSTLKGASKWSNMGGQKDLFKGFTGDVGKPHKPHTSDTSYADTNPQWDWWNKGKKHTQPKLDTMGKNKPAHPFKDQDPTTTTNDPSEQRIHNPDTGNDILLKTALGYPPDHPARKAADEIMRNEKPQNIPDEPAPENPYDDFDDDIMNIDDRDLPPLEDDEDFDFPF